MSIFTKVKAPKLPSSVFNLSHEAKLSCNMGDLVPILCQEILPGDKFKVSTELLIKMAPLKAPVMHRLTAFVHYFFVPTFQVDNVFERFINPKVNVNNSVALPFTSPSLIYNYGQKNGNSGGMIGTLADYLGLPITQSSWVAQDKAAGGYALIDPFRCYQHIYNSFYRDQNLEVLEGADYLTSSLFLTDLYKDQQGYIGSDMVANQLSALFRLRKRAWAKDYFTSALPSPQAGDDVLVPMAVNIQPDGDLLLQSEASGTMGAPAGGQPYVQVEQGQDLGTLMDYDDNPLHYKGGLKGVNGSATINDLRRAMALQRFKELAERGGTRYSEMVRNFFGAFLKDYWVDRPIFLGGQKQQIKVGEVVQTSSNTSDWALGYRGGIAQSYGKTKFVTLSAPCHGYLFGILSIRPEGTYQQGLERMWSRKSLYDFAFPQFANLGEQEILQQEIFATGTDSDNKTVFGYTPRYAEYKTGHCHVAGEFRNTLAYWHFGRIFDNAPTLSKEFVMMGSVPTRPFNVTDASTEHVYIDLYNTISARRRLPYFGTPSVL